MTRKSPAHLPYIGIAVLSLALACATAILSAHWPIVFQRFFGSVDPLVALASIALLGFVSLVYLDSGGGFTIYRQGACLRGVMCSALLATLFALAVILVDVCLTYPKDLNVALPQSLLFYPVMGYVAEIAFHTMPLTVLFLLATRVLGRQIDDGLVWLCIILVSFAEPIFQLSFEAKPLSSAGIYTGFHVFAISLAQLYIYRRYDFVSMYVFRLVYYFYWHIAWGYLRLQWLF